MPTQTDDRQIEIFDPETGDTHVAPYTRENVEEAMKLGAQVKRIIPKGEQVGGGIAGGSTPAPTSSMWDKVGDFVQPVIDDPIGSASKAISTANAVAGGALDTLSFGASRMLPGQEQVQAEHPTAYTVGEIVGGLAGIAGAGKFLAGKGANLVRDSVKGASNLAEWGMGTLGSVADVGKVGDLTSDRSVGDRIGDSFDESPWLTSAALVVPSVAALPTAAVRGVGHVRGFANKRLSPLAQSVRKDEKAMKALGQSPMNPAEAARVAEDYIDNVKVGSKAQLEAGLGAEVDKKLAEFATDARGAKRDKSDIAYKRAELKNQTAEVKAQNQAIKDEFDRTRAAWEQQRANKVASVAQEKQHLFDVLEMASERLVPGAQRAAQTKEVYGRGLENLRQSNVWNRVAPNDVAAQITTQLFEPTSSRYIGMHIQPSQLEQARETVERHLSNELVTFAVNRGHEVPTYGDVFDFFRDHKRQLSDRIIQDVYGIQPGPTATPSKQFQLRMHRDATEDVLKGLAFRLDKNIGTEYHTLQEGYRTATAVENLLKRAARRDPGTKTIKIDRNKLLNLFKSGEFELYPDNNLATRLRDMGADPEVIEALDELARAHKTLADTKLEPLPARPVFNDPTFQANKRTIDAHKVHRGDLELDEKIFQAQHDNTQAKMAELRRDRTLMMDSPDAMGRLLEGGFAKQPDVVANDALRTIRGFNATQPNKAIPLAQALKEIPGIEKQFSSFSEPEVREAWDVISRLPPQTQDRIMRLVKSRTGNEANAFMRFADAFMVGVGDRLMVNPLSVMVNQKRILDPLNSIYREARSKYAPVTHPKSLRLLGAGSALTQHTPMDGEPVDDGIAYTEEDELNDLLMDIDRQNTQQYRGGPQAPPPTPPLDDEPLPPKEDIQAFLNDLKPYEGRQLSPQVYQQLLSKWGPMLNIDNAEHMQQFVDELMAGGLE